MQKIYIFAESLKLGLFSKCLKIDSLRKRFKIGKSYVIAKLLLIINETILNVPPIKGKIYPKSKPPNNYNGFHNS